MKALHILMLGSMLMAPAAFAELKDGDSLLNLGEGSTIVIDQNIFIPANMEFVYIQAGKDLHGGADLTHHPYCAFVLNKPFEHDSVISETC